MNPLLFFVLMFSLGVGLSIFQAYRESKKGGVISKRQCANCLELYEFNSAVMQKDALCPCCRKAAVIAVIERGMVL